MIEIDLVGLAGVSILAAMIGYLIGYKSSADRLVEKIEYNMMKDECKFLRDQLNESTQN